MDQLSSSSNGGSVSVPPFLIVLGSFLFFAITRTILGHLFTARYTNNNNNKSSSSSCSPHPLQQQQNSRQMWKVVNTANSLLHSLITGVGALICFYESPEHAVDVVRTVSGLSIWLTSFSVGYFLFDVFDMTETQLSRRSTKELLVHHAFVLLCFGTSLWSLRYLGFVMVALIIEVNSVFLHWRQLLLMLLRDSTASTSSSSSASSSSSSVPSSSRPSTSFKSSRYYRTVSLLNLVSFVSFRIVTMGWMTRWLVLNKSQVTNEHVYALGCIAMATIVGMSAVLFVRLIRADLPYFLKNDHQKHS